MTECDLPLCCGHGAEPGDGEVTEFDRMTEARLLLGDYYPGLDGLTNMDARRFLTVIIETKRELKRLLSDRPTRPDQ